MTSVSAVPLAPRLAPALKRQRNQHRGADSHQRETDDRARQRGHGDRERESKGRDQSAEPRHGRGARARSEQVGAEIAPGRGQRESREPSRRDAGIGVAELPQVERAPVRRAALDQDGAERDRRDRDHKPGQRITSGSGWSDPRGAGASVRQVAQEERRSGDGDERRQRELRQGRDAGECGAAREQRSQKAPRLQKP